MALMKIKPLCGHCGSYDVGDHSCETTKGGWYVQVRTCNGYRSTLAASVSALEKFTLKDAAE
jgi:hypothetical protein